ncbi:cytidylate kinase family protein [Gemmatimonadota bacterium]
MAIISVCRGTKSGGEALAKCLEEKLGYPLLGREVLQEAAAQLGVPAKDVGEKMEEVPGFFGRTSMVQKLYVAAVQAALAEAAAGGNLIYHGLAGGLLLREAPGVLCTRLISPLEMRVHALMVSHGMDEASAEAYIHDVDDARARWVKGLYGMDINDPGMYDMVVNLASFSVPEACEVVFAAAQRPEFEIDDERLLELGDFRLGSRVRLALLEDLGTQTLELGATAMDGVVVVTGQAPMLNTGEVGDRIVEIVRSVPGVQEVSLRIEWFDPYP